MIERHYDEEALISLLESRREATDTHLPSCPPCSGKLDSIRTIAGALRDRDVWDKREIRTEAVPATIATLRAFADRMVFEDTKAEAILTELLAGARETWMPRLQAHPEWRTAGVARKLIESATRAIDTMPPDAVEMTALATEVADHLDQTEFPSDTIPRLRGAAWRERAYALYYTGNYVDADRAIFVSESHFSSCVVNEYELGRLGIVRALVLRAFERVAEAVEATAQSADIFLQHDDLARLASARMAHARLLYDRGEFATAEAALIAIEKRLRDSTFFDTHARVLSNLAFCARKLGRVDEAVQRYSLASALFAELDNRPEAVRLRWGVTLMLAETGRFADAYQRLNTLMPEMEQLGMASEAALNALTLAELLLAEQRYGEVAEICQHAIASIQRSGLGYTARALTALAFMREAAEQQKASKKLVRNVHDYISRLRVQPNLLFAPPPL
jgi:tetratricopeptide (TPR) repeat protein